MKVILFVLPIILTACATATKVYDAKGQEAIHIACDGAGVPMSYCYDKANSECPSGYIKLAESIANVGQISNGSLTANTYALNGLTTSTPIIEKSITIRCK